MLLLPRLNLAVLSLLLIFGHLLAASNLEERLEPQGDLYVGLDYALVTKNTGKNVAEKARMWMFSSYLVFEDEITPSSITNGQLRRMAIDALKEAREDITQYGHTTSTSHKKYLPGVMTLMTFGNEIILSSSQKGDGSLITRYPDHTRVGRVLDLCQIWWRDEGHTNPATKDKDHKHQRKCGEVGAFWLYYQLAEDHPTDIKDLVPLARTLTVHFNEETKEYEIMKPCGTGQTEIWGCNVLTDYEDNDANGEFSDKVDYLKDPIESEDYDLKKIAGGLKKVGQIQTCSKNKVNWRGD